jgi:hypothetical protein
MFFAIFKNTAKQLKLRNPSRGFALMPKLVYERKVCSMHKIISMSFIPSLIEGKKGGVKSKLGLLFPFKLGMPGV